MRQPTLTEGFEKYRKKTRKEQFLEEMETIIPLEGAHRGHRAVLPESAGCGSPSGGR